MLHLIFFAVCAVVAIVAWYKWAPKKPPVNMVSTPEDYYEYQRRRAAVERKKRRLSKEAGEDEDGQQD